jgi:hypothetical protein
MSVPYVCHDLVPTQYAASLISELFRDPFPRVAVSPIRDAFSHAYPFSAGIGRLNPYLRSLCSGNYIGKLAGFSASHSHRQTESQPVYP